MHFSFPPRERALSSVRLTAHTHTRIQSYRGIIAFVVRVCVHIKLHTLSRQHLSSSSPLSSYHHTYSRQRIMVQGTPLGKGIFVPIPTFFKPENEDLDLEALEKHIKYMCNTGVAGIIFMGSTGEAVHLSDEERITMISKGREFIQKYDPSVKVLAGAGIQSARGTIKLAKDAAAAGAGHVLVLPPSYYKPSMSSDALYAFFKRVADESPIPVVIYNYPGVTQGVDIDAQTIVKLAKHPNIVGIKGTDGNIGKVGYVAHRITPEDNFALLAGSVDFFLPALAVGAVGCVPGLGNVAPRACVEIQKLFEKGDLEGAKKLQQTLVEPDDALARWYGNPGVKGCMQRVLGWGGLPRNPLQPLPADQVEAIAKAVGVSMTIEQSLTTSS
ncbi:hypothetical protein BDB00DRAFT_847477 [Zychaea mexicana]|uniref:uncharacterized protein n=1 Tax=Zychaea mexicana TaxID=64656 RepID=UPI0022FE915C|nr:uncharacterized protein BDB00DRAFT_847477 [Zychaea mexicana]KAI9488585.1 hypothetical protein BDB00DRAFT_847477 [Zychaea mexicana]